MNRTIPSPEATLLLVCINTSSSAEEKSSAIDNLLRQKLDWNRFTSMVMTHALASTVCAQLKTKLGADGIPAQIFAGLRYWELVTAKEASQNATELAALMSRFDAAKIPAIVFKGPALSVVAYGNPVIRDYSDLDILVRRSYVVSAAELLISAGFKVRSYNREVFESGFFRNKSDDFCSDRAAIDLHWTLQDCWFPFGPDEDALWSRTEAFLLNGREFRTLGAADHLMFLCVHACKHGWPHLASVIDIAALLTARPELNLVALVDEATRLRFRRVTLLGFWLAHRLAGAPLGNEVLRIIERDHAVCNLTDQLSARLLTQLQSQNAFTRWLTVASTLESRSARVHMFAAHSLIPIAEDYGALPLPRVFYPLYYLLRPLRLAAKATTMMARSL